MSRVGPWTIGLLLAGCTRANPFFALAEETGAGSGTSEESGASEASGAETATTGAPLGPCGARGDADGDEVCDDEDRCAGGDDRVDEDADGTPNLCDPCVRDPDDDADGDGVCGDVDVCAGDDRQDKDKDGQADACDACPQDPGDDGDGDGVCDGVDQCPGADDSADANGNGVPDGCDECPEDAKGDSDEDGVCDGQDKCPDFDDTLEADGDGVPDGCDACPQDPGNDIDEDGVCDDVDNCPGSFNPDQLDADGDGHGDPCDVCRHPGYSDDDADYDGDGLPCAQDPCLFDGPEPPGFPAQVGPFEEIVISEAKVAGGGASAVVAPGALFSLKYHWKANFCECKICIPQGMVGLAGYPPNQCFYNPYSNLGNCKTHEKDTEQLFKAPAQPGMYFFRFRRTWEFGCVGDATLEDPKTEFAAICVK